MLIWPRDKALPLSHRSVVHAALRRTPPRRAPPHSAGQELVRCPCEPGDVLGGPCAEGEIDTTLLAEEIRDQPERAPRHAPEEERRSTRGDHAPMDLRDFEVGGDFDFDLDELTLAPEEAEVLA